MGTTVFNTIAYEKKTRMAITVDPLTGAAGIKLSQGNKD